jgi:hypothetical protein
MFRSDGGAQSIATIPLDSYTPEGAAAVILLFAYWGLSQLLLGLLYVLVLWRYRALVPLVYLLLFLEYAGRMALAAWKPIDTLSTPPGAIANPLASMLALVMLGLALRPAGPEGRPRPHERVRTR